MTYPNITGSRNVGRGHWTPWYHKRGRILLKLGLMVVHLRPAYHLPGNVICAAVGLVYINLQPEYELPSSTRFGQFQKFGKICVGGPKWYHWILRVVCTLLVIDCTRSRILHRCRDLFISNKWQRATNATNMSQNTDYPSTGPGPKSLHLATLLAFNPRRNGSMGRSP